MGKVGGGKGPNIFGFRLTRDISSRILVPPPIFRQEAYHSGLFEDFLKIKASETFFSVSYLQILGIASIGNRKKTIILPVFTLFDFK